MFRRNTIPLWIGIILMSGFFLMGQDWEVPELEPGIIVMWSGSISAIPSGWALCDGTNGTPDLTDRFVVGAGNSYSVDDTGGASSHSHGPGSYTGPNHTHTYSGVTAPGGTYIAAMVGEVMAAPYSHTHNYSGTTDPAGSSPITGTSASADSLPPYYALAYIMKL